MRQLSRQAAAVRVQAIQTARARLQVVPGNAALTRNLLDAEQQWADHLSRAATVRVDTAATLWDLYGEGSTHWFHRLGKLQQGSQDIAAVHPHGRPAEVVQLTDAAGTQRAGHILADFYDPAKGGLFTVAATDPQAQQQLLAAVDSTLSPKAQQQCLGPSQDGSISLAEAAAALATMPRGKAPGSDGLSYEFYTACWAVMGQPLVDAFNSVFSSQQQQPQLSAVQRAGLIVLLYKGGGKNPADPDSYRPITLLNTDVKIIAKVLAMRMGPALDGVVDDTQTGFVPGRDIADNVLFHLEEVEYLAEVQQPGCILFLDFAKAYDKLDRPWLFMCMQRLGFPASTVRWVQLLLHGTTACITYNGGHCSRTFDVPSGCAQGSPLSPLLYVIAAQPLAARCRQVQRSPQFASVQLPDGTAAPCCHQHADDTTLHAASTASLKLLLNAAVEPYCSASGSQLSLSKCTGITLGSSQPIAGLDVVTGVPFAGPDQPVRHLGVLLNRSGAEQFAQKLYTERLKTITWRIRHWARYKLTMVGRCEVAKQVLASSLAYHVQFVMPAEGLLQAIHRKLTAFVVGMGALAAADTRQLQATPSQAVASLPKDMGGMGQVDVRAHALAMQAKVAARLLHPKRAPWKVLMAQSLERALPGLGVAVLVRRCKLPRYVGIRQRHRQHISAFAQVGLQRHVPHADMTRQQLRLELLVGNPSVGGAADGAMLTSKAQLPLPLRQYTTLGQAAPQLQGQPQQDGIVLPAQWVQQLKTVAPVPVSWQVHGSGRWVRQCTEGGQCIHFTVLPSQKLLLSNTLQAVPDPAAGWQDACVVDVKAPLHPVAVRTREEAAQRRQQQQQQQGQQQGQQHNTPQSSVPLPPVSQQLPGSQSQVPGQCWYLVGPWATTRVDPSVWGFGPLMGVLQFTVRGATRRLLQRQCSQRPGWRPGLGMMPRLWRNNAGDMAVQAAVQELEGRQKRTWQQMMGGSSNSQAGQQAEVTAQLSHAYLQPWMLPSPPRTHVRQRVAESAAVVTQQRQQQEQAQAAVTQPVANDLQDPLTGTVELPDRSTVPWLRAYSRVQDKRLPRAARVFGWRLLHNGLYIGADKVRHKPPGVCACQHLQCQQQQQPPLETLSHVFLECPVAVEVVSWFVRVWDRVQPGAVVPATPRVLMLDDDTAFAPAQGVRFLWTAMRLLLLQSLHVVRQQAAGQPGFTARAVVGRFVAVLKVEVDRDWSLMTTDIRGSAGVPLSWFRTHVPALDRDGFAAKWCANAVVATCGNGEYRFQLSAAGM
jgi:hypothetical protein